MTDREKVIKGLECCQLDVNKCLDCPYLDKRNKVAECGIELHRDALALLKAQEPVVMAGAELTDAELIDVIRKAPITLRPTIDAIPVEWMRDKMRGYASALKSTELKALVTVMQMWQKEQGAR